MFKENRLMFINEKLDAFQSVDNPDAKKEGRGGVFGKAVDVVDGVADKYKKGVEGAGKLDAQAKAEEARLARQNEAKKNAESEKLRNEADAENILKKYKLPPYAETQQAEAKKDNTTDLPKSDTEVVDVTKQGGAEGKRVEANDKAQKEKVERESSVERQGQK